VFDAVIFDFDGLILDTETPLYEAWSLTFAAYGLDPIPLDRWATSLGRHDDDPLMLDPVQLLRTSLGRVVAVGEVQAVRRRHRDDLLDSLPIQPGVVTLLDEAEQCGVPVAIASSSPPDWIERHLGPRGLLPRFATMACAGDGVPGKPDPAVYLDACRMIGADPARSLALEDSPNGVTAAKSAEMICVAVPTALGRALDFTHADRVVDSLAHVTIAQLATDY